MSDIDSSLLLERLRQRDRRALKKIYRFWAFFSGGQQCGVPPHMLPGRDGIILSTEVSRLIGNTEELIDQSIK